MSSSLDNDVPVNYIGGADYFDTAPGIENIPIIFIHGNQRGPEDWDEYFNYFLENGYLGNELWAIDISKDILTHDAIAVQLEALVSFLSREYKIDTFNIVSHSLGVTGARHWMEYFNRYGSVSTFIGIAGANHGMSNCPPIEVAESLPLDNPLRPCSYFSVISSSKTPPIKKLNEGGETKGDIDYYTIRGEHDPLFSQNPESPILKGAIENVSLDEGHMGVLKSETSIKLVYKWLNRKNSL